MKIAVIKEIKQGEHRVAITPAGVAKLVKAGHGVNVEKGAGLGAAFSDADYRAAGAKIAGSPQAALKNVRLLVKVKELLPREFPLLKLMSEQILFSYLHLASTPGFIDTLLKNRVAGIDYETVEDAAGKLPLLRPMSQVAGIMAITYGSQLLLKKHGGIGITLGAVDDAYRAQVVIVGGGTVGESAAITAAGMGAQVTLLDNDPTRLKALGAIEWPGGRVELKRSNARSLAAAVKRADLLIGAVLSRGEIAPVVVDDRLQHSMKRGSVIVDVAIDQGGCIAGTRPTTHGEPSYEEGGRIYCNVTNLPAQAPLQSTRALTAATLPYVMNLARYDLRALARDDGFARGLQTHDGKLTYRPLAASLCRLDDYETWRKLAD